MSQLPPLEPKKLQPYTPPRLEVVQLWTVLTAAPMSVPIQSFETQKETVS